PPPPKARAALMESPGRSILAADTVVAIDGQILGKPVNADDARRMLHLLSGRMHEGLTAVALVTPQAGRSSNEASIDAQVEVTAVEFATLDKAEIDWYVQTGEPSDKAAAYAI